MAERILLQGPFTDLRRAYSAPLSTQALSAIPETGDVFIQWAAEAAWLRHPSLTPPDGLPLIGRDRRIVRGSRESAEAYAQRLRQWADVWRLGGLHLAVLFSVQAFLAPDYPRVRLVNRASTWYTLESGAVLLGPDGAATLPGVRDDGSTFRWVPPPPDLLGGEEPRTAFWLHKPAIPNFNWDGEAHPERAGRWWDFWIVIEPPYYPLVGRYDTGLLYDDPLQTWGFAEDGGTFDALKSIVADFKSAVSQPVGVIFAPDGTRYDPAAVPPVAGWPDGWYSVGARVIDGVWTPTRRRDERYLDLF